MKKEELLARIEELSKEKRAIADSYLDPEQKVEDLDKRAAEISKELEQRKRELAQLEMPEENPEEKRSALLDSAEWRKLATGEKRSLTIGSTGAINQIKTLFKEIADNDDILNKVTFYYGANAATNIPVLAPMSDPSDYAEGATSVTSDTSASVSVTEIQPKAYAQVLPITAEALTMNTINLEAELPGIFQKAFRRVMHKGVVVGEGTTKKMKGIFTSAAASTNKTDLAGTSIKVSELHTLALSLLSKDETFEIVMNPSVYSGILADTTADETIKILKEEIIRNKTIEGVKIRLEPQAPVATTAGSVLAVGVPLSRYAVGVAAEMQIEPIKVKGDTNTYFQATMFFSGKQISDKDCFALAVKES